MPRFSKNARCETSAPAMNSPAAAQAALSMKMARKRVASLGFKATTSWMCRLIGQRLCCLDQPQRVDRADVLRLVFDTGAVRSRPRETDGASFTVQSAGSKLRDVALR